MRKQRHFCRCSHRFISQHTSGRSSALPSLATFLVLVCFYGLIPFTHFIFRNLNNTIIYIDINTSRDNSSDYFVRFKPSIRIIKNGELVCSLFAPERNDEQFFGENLIIDISESNKDMPEEYRKMLPNSIETRMWAGPYFQCWNVAYPEQQKKAVEEAARWFDERLFSDEKVINAIGKKIKSE